MAQLIIDKGLIARLINDMSNAWLIQHGQSLIKVVALPM